MSVPLRKWLWRSLLGLGICLALIGGTHIAVLHTLARSDAYEAAKKVISSNPQIRREIGRVTNITIITGHGGWSGVDGQVDLRMSVKGAKSSGEVVMHLVKQKGVWSARGVVLELDHGKRLRVE